MKVYFRVDASEQIGSGHVMRCLTIAHQLRELNLDVIFICRKSKGDLIRVIQNQKFEVASLPEVNTIDLWGWTKDNYITDVQQTLNCIKNNPIGLLIIDHYSIDIKWESILKKSARKIMVIDDLANRQHNCDILLDQNYFENASIRYKELIPKNTQTLIGPNFILLRNEFFHENQEKKDLNRIFVFFGGVDLKNETKKTLNALQKISNIFVDVVIGSNNPHKQEIQTICSKLENYSYYCQVDNMAEIMSRATISIGSGGTITWEKAFLRIPSIVISVAENQTSVAESLAKKGAIIYLGESEKVNILTIEKAIRNLLSCEEKQRSLLKNMSTILNRNIILSKPLQSVVANIIKSGEINGC